MAERLAAGSGKRVLIIDKRPHIGGNAYDEYDEHGILVHKYGPHIFHTNARDVFEYLSRFTEWRPYHHRVRACVDGQLVPIPINLDTINQLYGTSYDSFQVEGFYASIAEPREPVKTSEDVVVSKVGRQLYEKFFRNYTRKRRHGHCPHPRPHQPGRPVFHRHLPGDAPPWFLADVRAHARAPEHQNHAQY
jgi:UDP-galactopyranose mutase